MTSRTLSLLAAGGSAALLIGAYLFQYVGGLFPCQMCLWQRWPHAAAILIGVAILVLPSRALALLGAAAALATASIGFFHVGVEQGWWEGLTACSAGGVSDLSATELMDQIMTAPLVRCDEIAWALGGISMAGWNAIVSLLLAGLWIASWRRAA